MQRAHEGRSKRCIGSLKISFWRLEAPGSEILTGVQFHPGASGLSFGPFWSSGRSCWGDFGAPGGHFVTRDAIFKIPKQILRQGASKSH